MFNLTKISLNNLFFKDTVLDSDSDSSDDDESRNDMELKDPKFRNSPFTPPINNSSQTVRVDNENLKNDDEDEEEKEKERKLPKTNNELL